MGNTIEIMMFSHLECTGVPGWELSIWVDITFGIAPRAGILLPLKNRQHAHSWMDLKIKLWICTFITPDNHESDSNSNYGP
jgi:hypothetical protein